jgi:hypothetical protein
MAALVWDRIFHERNDVWRAFSWRHGTETDDRTACVARRCRTRFGGLFWRKEAAIHFARSSASPANCATVFPSEHIELDLDNNGNPLLASIGALKRQLVRGVHRLIGAVQAAVRR